MFDKKTGKHFLTLTYSEVSLILSLVQERQASIFTYENISDEVLEESFGELFALQYKLLDYLIHYEND